MSLGSVLSIARSGMNAQQTIIQTAGHNIANVQTEGYSRQRVELTENYPERWSYGSIGTGVVITNVTHARDEMLDASYRTEASGAAASQLRHDLLASVEGVLGEPSDTGLSSAMDAFWSSWSDLASQPTSTAARSVVQQRGNNVASILNSFDSRLTDLRSQTLSQLETGLTQINTLAQQIAALNGQITSSEVGGNTAGDLRDQRDLAIDKLAKLGSVRVIPANDGSAQVELGNNTIVDGVNARTLETMTTSTGALALKLRNGVEPILPVGGTTQATLDFLNVDLVDTQGRLDALAQGLVTQVNAAHTAGVTYSAAGVATAAPDFFDASMGLVTARSIRLSTQVAASASNIAASAAFPSGTNIAGPGNNEVALSLAGFRSAPNLVTYVTPAGTTENDSFGNFYRDTASRLGTQVTNAGSDAQVHDTLATQADARRQSVSGVNLDEELTTLMRAQQAYAAAAKVISTASEMMKTLVDM
ncbi:MAG: flagellar hook-associated protein FlgK [Gemmatirosa sp.]|nr:flagellar hook-associated protein FlgK [Gemmatirosa sp.]